MAVMVFSRPGQRRDYIRWFEAHPDGSGYVLNEDPVNPKGTRLHSTACGVMKAAIEKAKAGELAITDNPKHCSESLQELEAILPAQASHCHCLPGS